MFKIVHPTYSAMLHCEIAHEFLEILLFLEKIVASFVQPVLCFQCLILAISSRNWKGGNLSNQAVGLTFPGTELEKKMTNINLVFQEKQCYCLWACSAALPLCFDLTVSC